MWFAQPRVGDWVRTTRTEHTGVIDALTGPGLPAGTRAVVLSRSGSRARVRADAEWGAVELTVPAGRLRVTHRGRGVEAFDRRLSLRAAVRLGAAIALVGPLMWFVVSYLWAYRTLEGIEVALVTGLLDSLASSVVGLINEPVRGAVAMTVGALAVRMAFGGRRRRTGSGARRS